jgi:hypothetical protein
MSFTCKDNHPYKRMPAYVYFVYDAEKNKVKIGWAVDPTARLEDLQRGNSGLLELLHVVGCSSRERAMRMEGYFHRILDHIRVRGEWFECSSELLSVLFTLSFYDQPEHILNEKYPLHSHWMIDRTLDTGDKRATIQRGTETNFQNSKRFSNWYAGRVTEVTGTEAPCGPVVSPATVEAGVSMCNFCEQALNHMRDGWVLKSEPLTTVQTDRLLSVVELMELHGIRGVARYVESPLPKNVATFGFCWPYKDRDFIGICPASDDLTWQFPFLALHEVSHALTPRDVEHGHGPEWQEIVLRLGHGWALYRGKMRQAEELARECQKEIEAGIRSLEATRG